MESLIQSGIIPQAFLRLLGSSVFGLDAAIALGVGHPIAIALQVVYPVGLRGGRDRGRAAERDARGAARPPGLAAVRVRHAAGGDPRASRSSRRRRRCWARSSGRRPTASSASSTPATRASCSSTRCCCSPRSPASRWPRRRRSTALGPAIAIGLAVVLLGYVLEILGQLWPDAEVVQPYSPFHYLRPFAILGGQGEPDGPAGAARRVRGRRGLRAVALPAPRPGRAVLMSLACVGCAVDMDVVACPARAGRVRWSCPKGPRTSSDPVVVYSDRNS